MPDVHRTCAPLSVVSACSASVPCGSGRSRNPDVPLLAGKAAGLAAAALDPVMVFRLARAL